MKKILLAACLLLALIASAVAQVPASKVFVVVGVRHSYAGTIGNPSMPYLNSLANQYGLATQYFANTQPTIGDYFMMTTGQTIATTNAFTGTVDADNIVRRMMTAGKTWKAYAEDLPSAGYLGGSVNGYAKYRNPFAYLSDVVNSSTEALNIVPFSQFGADNTAGQLPDYSFIIPNTCNAGQTCSLSISDQWLKTNIAPLLASAAFQNNGLLIITFDASTATDLANGGGRVATVVISSKAKAGLKSTTFYQHQSLLRLTMAAMGMTSFPGAAATANDMGEFFGTSSNSTSGTSSPQTAPSNLAPVAAMNVTPSTGTAPVNVTVDSSASYDPDGSIASRTITFGDGASIAAATATHTYSAAGTYVVTLKVTDNLGMSSTATKTVTVTAATPTTTTATLSPTSLTFASQNLGTTSAAQTVTLKNTGSVALTIGTVSASGDFHLATSTCTGSLAAGASCSVGVNFTPTTTGTRTGTLTVNSANSATQTASLSGTGASTTTTAPSTAPSTSGSATAKPYTSSSPWNTPIGSNPQISPNSAGMVSSLTGSFGSDPTAYTMPLYIVNSSTPMQTVTFSGVYKEWACNTCDYTSKSGSVTAPIPAGAVQAPGTDAQIILWNPATGDEYEFWGYDASTHTAKNGYHYNSNWSAVINKSGPRGAGVPYLAGLIRPWEIAQGHIDHAIAFAYQNSGSTYVWPASKTDGGCTGSGTTCLPEGSRLQLDPTLDVNSLGLSPAGVIIAKALQQYGMILIDKAGHPKLYAEYNGTADWNGVVTNSTVSNIPLSRFRVLDPNSHIGQQ